MTRVNCGVDPHELPSQALLAEHREITRIPNAIRRNPKIGATPLPENFRFGEGHLRFFYNKLGYLHNRYWSIYTECKRRGYNITCKEEAFQNLPTPLMGDYTPSLTDRNLTLALLLSKRYRVKGQKIKLRKVSVKRIKG